MINLSSRFEMSKIIILGIEMLMHIEIGYILEVFLKKYFIYILTGGTR